MVWTLLHHFPQTSRVTQPSSSQVLPDAPRALVNIWASAVGTWMGHVPGQERQWGGQVLAGGLGRLDKLGRSSSENTHAQRMLQKPSMPGPSPCILPGVEWKFPGSPPPAQPLEYPSAGNSPNVGLVLVVLASEVAR